MILNASTNLWILTIVLDENTHINKLFFEKCLDLCSADQEQYIKE